MVVIRFIIDLGIYMWRMAVYKLNKLDMYKRENFVARNEDEQNESVWESYLDSDSKPAIKHRTLLLFGKLSADVFYALVYRYFSEDMVAEEKKKKAEANANERRKKMMTSHKNIHIRTIVWTTNIASLFGGMVGVEKKEPFGR